MEYQNKIIQSQLLEGEYSYKLKDFCLKTYLLKIQKQTKLAPDLSYKYEIQLNRMIQKIKKQGIDVMKPTSDAAKAAYTKLKSTPSIHRLYFDRAKAGRKFQNI